MTSVQDASLPLTDPFEPSTVNVRPFLVKRNTRRAEFEAFFSLSQTQRRLAWRYKREAIDWERQGNLKNYQHCRAESDRLWHAAWLHIEFARRRYHG